MSKGKFLGDTAGNANLPPNRTSGNGGGSGKSAGSFNVGKYAGASTPGNTNLKPDRSSGVAGGKGGGAHKAGGRG